MQWLVQLALRRPYTMIVLALLIGLMGGVSIMRMPTDIFPVIDIPVVTVIWNLSGVKPDEVEKRIVTICERAMTTTVNDIEHIESQSLNGVCVIKVYFQPGAKIEAAVAQVTAINQTIVRVLPPGTTPPFIIQYSASNVPVLQASVSSKTMSEQELYDQGLNFIRTQLATVQGASVPLPYGGKPRQIMVDLDPQALAGKGLTPTDVSNAINVQNLMLPTGSAKIGAREYNVSLNSSVDMVQSLNDLPIKQVNGATVYIRDVAQVHDGYGVQTSVVRQNGRRSSLITILKSGRASTLDIVARVKQALPKIQATLPEALKINLLFDQSIFVRNSINGVVSEALIAGLLTAAMILLFLGSWRSTLIVAVSIPLSILTSIIVLGMLGQTLNVMTLGGLALAVGILVDDATVEIENIHRNLAMGKPLKQAILDGAQQIATPTLVSTLCICIVFVPVVFLTGAAKSLFTPLGMAVVFAMLASYMLSRTLIPTLTVSLLRHELHLYREGEHGHDAVQGDIFWKAHQRFNRIFERINAAYQERLAWSLRHRKAVGMFCALFCVGSCALVPFLGQDFFPTVDSGQFRLHVRAPAGTRLEETERVFTRVENTIREVVPASELELILDNIGLAGGGTSLAFGDSATVGPSDGEILVALKEGKHGPTPGYMAKLRDVLRQRFPDEVFFFQPADIVSQILNFGLPSPIDIQIVGRKRMENYAIARQIEKEVSRIPGAVDVHLHQIMDAPELRLNVDRIRASQMGMTQRDVANQLLISLSSSGQAAPNYWLNPQNGVSYLVAVMTPQYKMNSLGAIQNTPMVGGTAGSPQLLGNLATVERLSSMAVVNHYNVQPVFNIYAGTQGRDLGGVAGDIDKILAKYQAKLPRGSSTIVRGEVESMRSSFLGLGMGLIFAIVLVYLLMVVNFQSWLDPFIILMALPGALAGIMWMLFVTQTTVSVPALMGTIMSVGVATANSILMVTFANDQRQLGMDAMQAALAAGRTRLRPVMMTALAMVIGMLPMSLGLGEGGEQNAPLGRAVIGGLVMATVFTLFFVPVVYSVLRKKAPDQLEDELPVEGGAMVPAS